MSYCTDKGIPHSVFLEWEPEDRAKTLAYILATNEKCSLCGTAPWEWSQDKFAYTPVEDFCQGCYQKSVFNDQNSKALPGTNVKLVATTPKLKAQMQVNSKKRQRSGKGF